MTASMRRNAFLSLLLLMPAAWFLWAAEPELWITSTQKELLQGEFKGVSVTSDGKLVLAPAFEQILDTEQAFVYSLVVDKGGRAYLGTGNNGKIFRVSPNGQGGEWAKLEELGVHALAVDSMNRIYAGTSPDGKIYRFNEGGEPRVFFDPEEKYIWALAVDGQDNLFAATGPSGIIYKITPQGQGSVFYDSRETHIVSLAWDLNANLLAGGAPGGLLFRISAEGKAFVLHDSPLEEIKAVTVDRYGFIYAAALASAKSREEKPGGPPAPGLKPAGGGDGDKPGTEGLTVQVAGSEKGARLEVYRVDKENLVELLYSSNQELVFDLLIRSDGNLLLATGNKGRILSIDPQKFLTLLVESREEQITRLVEREGKIYAATSNLGKLFQLLPQPSRQGIYESKIFDAKITSRWGVIRWKVKNPAPQPIRVYTRSGNTESPDQTWQAWSEPHTDPSGSYIQSSPARYLQWKIEFPESARPAAILTDTNAVEEVAASYLQHNVAPQVTSITVHPPGLAFVRYPTAAVPGNLSPEGPNPASPRSLPRTLRTLERQTPLPPARQVFSPGAQSFSWNSTDPNGDELVYSVFYRSQEETSWKLLEKELKEASYTMDAMSFPDGVYFVKVLASDRPANPPSQSLQSELISKAFVISNSPPALQVGAPQVEGNRVSLEFTARTRASTVHQAEYAVDAGPWNILFPKDQIADSSEEHYTLTVENLTRGEHSISLRVVDSVGNIGTDGVTVTIQY